MKHIGTWLITAAILFGIGFIVAPALRVFHVPTDTSEVLLGLNFLCGGLCCLVLAKLAGELG
jgi:hypothetical protein